MEFVVSQILGIIVSIAAILSMQLKNIKSILVCQLVCNGFGALSYILVGGLSGCGIYCVAILQTIICFGFNVKNKKIPGLLVALFACAFLVCSLTTYKALQDIISAVAALTCAFALAQSKARGYRIFMLLNGLIWMLYDVSVGAYTMIISHVVTFASAIIGMIRLDFKRGCK